MTNLHLITSASYTDICVEMGVSGVDTYLMRYIIIVHNHSCVKYPIPVKTSTIIFEERISCNLKEFRFCVIYLGMCTAFHANGGSIVHATHYVILRCYRWLHTACLENKILSIIVCNHSFKVILPGYGYLYVLILPE